MGALLGTWWPVLVLLYVPGFVRAIMSVVISRAFLSLDKSHPDDLPHTAGTWLNREIARLGLGNTLSVIVTDEKAIASLDAYHPYHETIQLSADTYFKRDPMHWAIAAHELGHARFRLAWPVVGRLIMVALFVKRLLLALACALVIGNVAYAMPHILPIAYQLFVIGIALHGLVLLDEAVASVLAMQSLRASEAYAWSHLKSARRVLALAYSTYVVGFASRALLLTQWYLVEKLTRAPLVPPTMQLTTIGIVVAAVMTFVVVVYTLWRIKHVIAPTPSRALEKGSTVDVASLAYQAALVVFILLVWNVRADREYAHWVMLALVPVSGWFLLVLALPMAILHAIFLERRFKRWIVDPTHRSDKFDRDHRQGSPQRARGNSAFHELLMDGVRSARLEQRLSQLLHLSHIPLVVAFWLS